MNKKMSTSWDEKGQTWNKYVSKKCKVTNFGIFKY